MTAIPTQVSVATSSAGGTNVTGEVLNLSVTISVDANANGSFQTDEQQTFRLLELSEADLSSLNLLVAAAKSGVAGTQVHVSRKLADFLAEHQQLIPNISFTSNDTSSINDTSSTNGATFTVNGAPTTDNAVQVLNTLRAVAVVGIETIQSVKFSGLQDQFLTIDLESLIYIVLLARNDKLTDQLKGKLAELQKNNQQMDILNARLKQLRLAASTPPTSAQDAEIKSVESDVQSLVNVSQRQIIEINQATNKQGEAGSLLTNLVKALDEAISNAVRNSAG
ncbi:MAG: hypothetical protein V4623_07825 [Pseudomonadota bacterium]